MRGKGLTAKEKLVAYEIIMYIINRSNGRSLQSQVRLEDISEELEMSISTVSRITKSLIEKNIFEVVKKSGQGKCRILQILEDKIPTCNKSEFSHVAKHDHDKESCVQNHDHEIPDSVIKRCRQILKNKGEQFIDKVIEGFINIIRKSGNSIRCAAAYLTGCCNKHVVCQSNVPDVSETKKMINSSTKEEENLVTAPGSIVEKFNQYMNKYKEEMTRVVEIRKRILSKFVSEQNILIADYINTFERTYPQLI